MPAMVMLAFAAHYLGFKVALVVAFDKDAPAALGRHLLQGAAGQLQPIRFIHRRHLLIRQPGQAAPLIPLLATMPVSSSRRASASGFFRC